jgi:hypothetical protein
MDVHVERWSGSDCGYEWDRPLNEDGSSAAKVTSPEGVESYLARMKGAENWYFVPWNDGKQTYDTMPIEGPIDEVTALVIARMSS